MVKSDFSVYLENEGPPGFFDDYQIAFEKITGISKIYGVAFSKNKNSLSSIRWDLAIYMDEDGKYKTITIFNNSKFIEDK
jgi:hypothetical protein